MKQEFSNLYSKAWLAGAKDELHARGVVSIRDVVPNEIRQTIRSGIINCTSKCSVRRDLTALETGDSARRMRNVRMNDILQTFPAVEAVYNNSNILDILTKLFGEEVVPCPYQPERFLITQLEKDGDTQGWHVDDYTVALMWVAETPGPGGGGFLQIAHHSDPSPKNREKTPIEYLEHSDIISYPCVFDDVYVISSREHLHRVFPVSDGRRRTVMNMTYATRSDLALDLDHASIKLLWS